MGEEDLVLNEKLDDANFEAEESTFAEELMTMPVFKPDVDDEVRLRTYTLQRVPPSLKKELEAYGDVRRSACGWRCTVDIGGARQHGVVALLWLDATHEPRCCWRFGHVHDSRRPWRHCSRVCAVAAEHAALQVHHDCQLSERPGQHHVVLLRDLAANDALLSMEPNPLTQLINLRGQAEKASKTQQMYDKRVGGWIEWEDVQKARVTAMKKLEDVGSGVAPAAKRSLLRDCCALSLLSLIPPDRVGCIRKLRWGHTLKRKPAASFAACCALKALRAASMCVQLSTSCRLLPQYTQDFPPVAERQPRALLPRRCPSAARKALAWAEAAEEAAEASCCQEEGSGMRDPLADNLAAGLAAGQAAESCMLCIAHMLASPCTVGRQTLLATARLCPPTVPALSCAITKMAQKRGRVSTTPSNVCSALIRKTGGPGLDSGEVS